MFSTISGNNLVFTDGTIRVSGTTLCLQKYDWRKIPIYNNGDVIYVLECDLSQNKIKNDLFKWQFKDGMIRSLGNSDFCWSVPLSQTIGLRGEDTRSFLAQKRFAWFQFFLRKPGI